MSPVGLSETQLPPGWLFYNYVRRQDLFGRDCFFVFLLLSVQWYVYCVLSFLSFGVPWSYQPPAIHWSSLACSSQRFNTPPLPLSFRIQFAYHVAFILFTQGMFLCLRWRCFSLPAVAGSSCLGRCFRTIFRKSFFWNGLRVPLRATFPGMDLVALPDPPLNISLEDCLLTSLGCS